MTIHGQSSITSSHPFAVSHGLGALLCRHDRQPLALVGLTVASDAYDEGCVGEGLFACSSWRIEVLAIRSVTSPTLALKATLMHVLSNARLTKVE